MDTQSTVVAVVFPSVLVPPTLLVTVTPLVAVNLLLAPLGVGICTTPEQANRVLNALRGQAQDLWDEAATLLALEQDATAVQADLQWLAGYILLVENALGVLPVEFQDSLPQPVLS